MLCFRTSVRYHLSLLGQNTFVYIVDKQRQSLKRFFFSLKDEGNTVNVVTQVSFLPA